MINIRITIEYDGKDFNGWQKQPTKLNIQGEIERAIGIITGEEVEVIGSGRTDAGVNALAQVANFKVSELKIPVDRLIYAINSQLKKTIRIISAEIVSEDFHSRYAAKRKTYRYTINNSIAGSAIYRNMQYHYPSKLDEKLMDEAAKYFIGEHDFKAFKASGTSSKSSVRDGNLINIELTGNGFLYNMVRIIAGTLLEVGEGKMEPSNIGSILKDGSRKNAGKTLPPSGLCLVSVEY